MKIFSDPPKIQRTLARLAREGRRIGFVPTMGAFHEGHLSLIRRARKENDIIVVSVFVNPLQFSPSEDFARYPRPRIQDIKKARQEGVDLFFAPSSAHMYPQGFATTIEVAGLSQLLCGQFRPGHFKGVTTVVAKLLNIIGPCTLYLGQKDAQQAVIIQTMISDLNFPVRVRRCPTVREPDGLALSSRNQYLTPRQRRQACVLFRALKQGREAAQRPGATPQTVCRAVRDLLRRETNTRIDYVACVDAETLSPLKNLEGNILLAAAIRLGSARLIDNIIFKK